jgi:hypothetical protein
VLHICFGKFAPSTCLRICCLLRTGYLPAALLTLAFIQLRNSTVCGRQLDQPSSEEPHLHEEGTKGEHLRRRSSEYKRQGSHHVLGR